MIQGGKRVEEKTYHHRQDLVGKSRGILQRVEASIIMIVRSKYDSIENLLDQSRKILQHQYVFTKVGFDTAENEQSKI